MVLNARSLNEILRSRSADRQKHKGWASGTPVLRSPGEEKERQEGRREDWCP